MLTRLHEHENSTLHSKLRIYDGETLKDTDPNAKSLQEYRDVAGVDEGMTGTSTRFAFKVLSETFNHDTEEIAADPVHLMYVLEQAVKREQFNEDVEGRFLEFLKAELTPRYAEFIGHEIQKAYLESYSDYGQNLFDRYIAYADAWIEEHDYKDPDTGQMFDREILDQELAKIEKPAGIANPKDFRNEVVKFVLRARAENQGKNPDWRKYKKLRRCDRETHVRPGRGPAASDQFWCQARQGGRRQASRVCRPHDRTRLHQAPGSTPCRVVHAGQQGGLTHGPFC